MKPIPRHTKSIEIEFTNLNTKDVCFRVTIPLTTHRELKISDLYKRLKPAIADGEGVNESRITAKHNVVNVVNTCRVLFEWRGGISLDVPLEASNYDYQIILAQLDVLKMKFTPAAQRSERTRVRRNEYAMKNKRW